MSILKCKPRILFYCQHVLGIGHFFRSLNLVKELSEFQILFVEGGVPFLGIDMPSHVERVFLPPLRMDKGLKDFTPDKEHLRQIKRERKEQLLKYYQHFKPDIIITELFPFGRHKFEFELLPLIEMAKADHVLMISSLRDILVEQPQDTELVALHTLELLNKYFDTLFIHSDQSFMPLNRTYPLVDRITIPIHYTGYIAPIVEKVKVKSPDIKRIALSAGGGKIGDQLIEAVIHSFKTISGAHLRLDIFLGCFLDDQEKDLIATSALEDSRITLLPFSADFSQQLAHYHLSISMAGYNTCMDLLATNIPALVYPFAINQEQPLRAQELENRGLITVIRDLDRSALAQLIERELAAPLKQNTVTIDLKGAKTTAALLSQLSKNHKRGRNGLFTYLRNLFQH